MIYITYNDLPSGVYNSQVIDVCKYFSLELKTPVRLVALISIRNFFYNRKKIKKALPNAIVIPMIPKHENWKLNIITLFIAFLFIRNKSIIGRGPFATYLALQLRDKGLVKKVCYDGRGAYTAEFNEYNVSNENHLKKEIELVEKRSVLESDYRIAVSNKLVQYWKDRFGYNGIDHSVIPCTFSFDQSTPHINENAISKVRLQMNFENNDIVLVFSGSTAGWQSLVQVDRYLERQFEANSNLKVLFLAKLELEKLRIYERFPSRVIQKWVEPHMVNELLAACDYGILMRDTTITNQVASPTKFAEYLLAGLPVLISERLGDFSDFVTENKCGHVVNDTIFELKRVAFDQKMKCFNLAVETFSKHKFKVEYMKLIMALS